jgi:hypothetical protein
MRRFLLEHAQATILSIGILAIVGAQLSPELASASEALVYACLVGVFVASPAVRREIADYPKPHRVIGIGVLAAMFAGQVIKEDRDLFPFVSWHMYSRPIAEGDRGVMRVRLIGITPDGQREPLDLDVLFGRGELAALNPGVAFRVSYPLRRFTRAIQRKRDPESRAKAEERLSSWTQAIARTWNDAHPDRALSSIDVEQSWMPLSRGFEGSEFPWELIYQVEATR